MKNGLYSFHIHMLDGVRGRDSGILILRCASLPANQRVYKLIQKVGPDESIRPLDKGGCPLVAKG